MEDDPNFPSLGSRAARLEERVAELGKLVEQLPEPERSRAREIVDRTRRYLKPIIDALKLRL